MKTLRTLANSWRARIIHDSIPVIFCGHCRVATLPVRCLSRKREIISSNHELAVNPMDSTIPADGVIEYITNSRRSLKELLSVDIRDFPAELRLTCLEAVTLRLLMRQGHRLDRFSEVSAVALGVEPTSTAALAFLPPSAAFSVPDAEERAALEDERMRVLVLSTVAGAKSLPRPRLLVLTACLRQIPGMANSKALASLLRLITHQINECSATELVYIASLLSGLETKHAENAHDGQGALPTLLNVEADLLRDALGTHVFSRLPEFESLGLMALLRLAFDFAPEMSRSGHQVDRMRFLAILETVISTSPKEQNLFTMCLMFAAMQRMNTFRPGLIRRCLGQVRRKLHLGKHYPLTDQSQWLSCALSALANLSTGGKFSPSSKSTSFSIHDFTTFSDGMSPDGAITTQSNLDIHPVLTSDWVRQLLYDVGDYGKEGSQQEPTTPTQTALALLLLGVRREKLLSTAKTRQFADLLIAEPSELLAPPDSCLADPVDSILVSPEANDLVQRLPRSDWRMYYELSTQIQTTPSLASLTTRQRGLFKAYVSLKRAAVEAFISKLRMRVGAEHGIEILPFHFVEILASKTSPTSPSSVGDAGGDAFFADFVIRKISTTDPSTSKYALCYLCWKRDVLVSRPFRTLRTVYLKKTSIPVIPMVYCDWLPAVDVNNQRDTFLKVVAMELAETACLDTEGTRVRSLGDILGMQD